MYLAGSYNDNNNNKNSKQNVLIKVGATRVVQYSPLVHVVKVLIRVVRVVRKASGGKWDRFQESDIKDGKPSEENNDTITCT